MAQSQYAYNFSLFDSYDYGTSAPAFEPTYEPEVKPVKKKTAKKQATPKVSEKQKAAAKTSHIASAKILLFLVVLKQHLNQNRCKDNQKKWYIKTFCVFCTILSVS